MIKKNVFYKIIIMILLSTPFIHAEESAEASPESLVPTTEKEEYNQKLYEHWLALAKLYEAQGNTTMAELAYGYAKDLLPQEIPSDTLESVVEPSIPNNIFVSQLHTYFSGWFERDEQKIMSVTAPVLLLPLYSDGLIKEDQVAFFQEFFASYPQFDQLTFDDIYDIESLSITQFDNSKAMLSIRSKDYPPLTLKEWNYWSNFWHNTHHYFFQRMADNQWYLLAFDMDEEDSGYFSINQEPQNSNGTS